MTGIVFTSKETSAVEDFGWLVKDFPTGRNGVADPDLLLSESHREMLVEKIQGSGETILVEGTETPIQVAVAVVGRVSAHFFFFLHLLSLLNSHIGRTFLPDKFVCL